MINLRCIRARALISAALASSLLFITAAQATEMTTGGPPAQYIDYLNMKPMKAMNMMDKDKKGYVTKEEYMKFHGEMFDRMDKNKDGKLTSEEWLGREVRKSDK